MPGLVDRLTGLDPSALTAFFPDHDAVAITALIPEFADDARLAVIDGVVCFDLERDPGARERHTVRFDRGAVTLLEDGDPDVTIGADLLDFVRLVTGQRNAALLYLA